MRKRISAFADFVTNEQEFSPTTAKLLSLVLLACAASITLMSFDTKRFFFLPAKLSITPSFLSGAVAVALLLPLYARGILRWSKSAYGLIILFLLWTVFAAIIQMGIQGKIDISEYLIAAAVVLSWLGMRSVAGVAWILAFAACILSIVKANTAMGGWGFVFLTSGFMGCLLHAGLTPARFVEEIRKEFQGFSPDAVKRVSGDVRAAKDLL